MADIAIVFHSVTGNTFFLAKLFASEFEKNGRRVRLLRVADPDVAHWQAMFPPAAEVAAELASVPEARPEDLPEADLVVVGTPTYFGNVSAELKGFLDSTAMFYSSRKLEGKFFAAFATSGSPEGGASLALQTLLHFAQHAGMVALPVPLAAQLAGENGSAYGIVHASGERGDRRPGERAAAAVRVYCDFLNRFPPVGE